MTTSDFLDSHYGHSDTGTPPLAVEDLHVGFTTDDGVVQAVRGVSFSLARGQALGLVGESGSGKSVTSMAIMGLLPRTAQISGSAKVLDQEMLGLDDAPISKIRGENIAMIFQDPLTSLNPVYTVGYQIIEAIRVHREVTKQQARLRAVELLDLVGIPFPEQRVDSYPHELSGGLRQRVVIAIAMANEPDVIIADEPTTALDVTVQAQIMNLLRELQQDSGMGLILITHDLGVVADVADRIAVMYAGRIVEQAPVDRVYAEPAHPYTKGLLESVPRVDLKGQDLAAIRGLPPSLTHIPAGCAFHPRCPYVQDVCRDERPPLLALGADRHSACHFSAEVLSGNR
jgi:oligopeptide/dipeptide ABC transporter ATP-binding protein